jgi:hypothetical protein
MLSQRLLALVWLTPAVKTRSNHYEGASIRPGDPLFRVAGSKVALPQSSVGCTLR